MIHRSTLVRPFLAGAISIAVGQVSVKAIPVLLDSSTSYTQNFNTLAVSGTSSSLPDGWASAEAGTAANSTYTAGTGSSTTGDLYSLGATGSSERALGGLQSGSLIPTFGVQLLNGTGQNIDSLLVSFTGEQWRLGTTGRPDRLDFQYSLDASSLTTGMWMDYDALDFSSPTTSGSTGLLNGNDAGNQQGLTGVITGLTFNPNEVIWFRWTDFNASGSDDVLAIDNFSVQTTTAAASPASVPDEGLTLSLLSVSLLGIFWLKRPVIVGEV